MNGGGFIYVLGDSHTRSFAYHTSFFPICIGGSMENCFLTSHKKEEAYERILANLKLLNKNIPVMLVLGEADTRHYWNDTQYTKDQLKEYFPNGVSEIESFSHVERMENAAKNYCEVIERLVKTSGFSIIVFNIIATERGYQNDMSRIYNGIVEQYCELKNIRFVNIWEEILDPGLNQVKKYYQAEFIHLNETIAPLVSSILGLSDNSEKDFFWKYAYKIKVNYGNSLIWGDHDKCFLRLKEGENHFWDKYHLKTKEHKLYIKALLGFMVILRKENTGTRVLLLDAGEGLFLDSKERFSGWTEFNGAETSKIRIRNGDVLASINKVKNRFVYFLNNYTKDKIPEHDIIISLDRASYLPSYKKELFENISKSCKHLIYLSYDLYNDRHSIVKAGFKYCYKIPLMEGGIGRHQSAFLLFATNQSFSKSFKIKYRILFFKLMFKNLNDSIVEIKDYHKK